MFQKWFRDVKFVLSKGLALFLFRFYLMQCLSHILSDQILDWAVVLCVIVKHISFPGHVKQLACNNI